MKRFLTYISLCVAMVWTTSCGGPQIIPDDELAQIFSEAYVQNAYLNAFSRGHDTLDIYTPIWERYGYTEEDMRFTIGNFSKRKSANLSDVVDEAIRIIEAERAAATHKLAVRDTLREIGRRLFARTVHYDTLIRIRRVADTAGLVIRIPVREEGDYDVSYSYVVDSTDKNHNLRTRHYVLNNYNRHSGENIHRMRRNEQRGHFKGNFKVREGDQYLVLDLNPYANSLGEMTAPDMRIDSLEVVFYMGNDKAQDSISRKLLRKTIPEDFQRFIKPWQDSVARRDSTLRAIADSIRMVEDSIRIAQDSVLQRMADSLNISLDSLRTLNDTISINATPDSTLHTDPRGTEAQ